MTIKFPKSNKFKLPNYLRTGSKYNNVPTIYKGHTFHSRFEAEYAMILDDMKKCKEIKSWEPQFTLRLEVNGKLICKYIADFWVVLPNGDIQITETKGFFSPYSKLKWKLAIALYPNYKFKLIKKI